MCFTGDGRYGPKPSRRGMHDGTMRTGASGFVGSFHGLSLWLSHPHPWTWGGSFAASVGPTPRKPSSCPATRSMWPPHDGTGSSLKARSEIT